MTPYVCPQHPQSKEKPYVSRERGRLRRRCRHCVRLDQKVRRLYKPDHEKQYRFDHREDILERQRAYRGENREKVNAARRAYGLRHRDRLRERARALYWKDPEKHRARKRVKGGT